VGNEVIYTAPRTIPESGSDDVAYTIREQNGGTISATGTITLDAGLQLIGADTTLSLQTGASFSAEPYSEMVTAADLSGCLVATKCLGHPRHWPIAQRAPLYRRVGFSTPYFDGTGIFIRR